MAVLPLAHRARLGMPWLLMGCLLASTAHADQTTVTASTATPNQSISTTARLDFNITIGRMLFFRVGTGGSFSGGTSGSGPAANSTVDTLALNATPSIPGTPTTPAATANNRSVPWNGGIPSFSSSGTSIGVEVRGNGGQITLAGQTTGVLTSGSNTIPMTAVTITSSDTTNLPAPVVPATGNSPAVSVALGGPGTAAAPALLTYRTANWTFAYNSSVSYTAGVYTGQITFTATDL